MDAKELVRKNPEWKGMCADELRDKLRDGVDSLPDEPRESVYPAQPSASRTQRSRREAWRP